MIETIKSINSKSGKITISQKEIISNNPVEFTQEDKTLDTLESLGLISATKKKNFIAKKKAEKIDLLQNAEKVEK